jgi:gas vesicle protein
LKETIMKKSGKLIGAGIGLAAVAAAGTYFLYGERGARNREKIAGWTLKMKGEVLEKVEELKAIDREAYTDLVDKVAARYAKLEKVSASELRRLTVELKNAWAHINKNLK